MRGRLATLSSRKEWTGLLSSPWSLIVAAAIVLGAVVTFSYARTGGALNSPDDASNYATARALVEEGRPWLEIPNDVPDEHDVMHPRAFVTVSGRAVPIQTLTTAASHALVWKLTGTFALSAGVFAGLGLLGWTAATRAVTRLDLNRSLGVVLLSMPIVYWLTRQYFTISTYLVCLGWAVALGIEAWRNRSWRLAAAAGALHGLTLSARPDFLFAHAAAFVVIVLASPLREVISRARMVACFAGSGGLVFAVIVFGGNMWLNGSATTFGYDIARANPGFEQPLQMESGVVALDTLAARLFPIGVANWRDIASMAWRYLVELTPVLAIATVIGMYSTMTQFGWIRAALVGATLIAFGGYVVLSRASTNLQGSLAPDPLPSHSLVRYFMPVTIACWYFSGRAIAWLSEREHVLARKGWRIALGAGGVLSVWQVFLAFEGVSLLPWSGNLSDRQAVFDEVFGSTEEDAIIVSATYDKFAIAAGRASISWSTVGANNGFDPLAVAEAIQEQVAAGAPVYVWDTAEVGPDLMRQLCRGELWLEQVQHRFYRVIQEPGCDELYVDVFGASDSGTDP